MVDKLGGLVGIAPSIPMTAAGKCWVCFPEKGANLLESHFLFSSVCAADPVGSDYIGEILGKIAPVTHGFHMDPAGRSWLVWLGPACHNIGAAR
jgi:hypothetical protein